MARAQGTGTSWSIIITSLFDLMLLRNHAVTQVSIWFFRYLATSIRIYRRTVDTDRVTLPNPDLPDKFRRACGDALNGFLEIASN
jgi:hypothetical protein